MVSYITSLYNELNINLQQISEKENPLWQAEQACIKVEESLHKLKEYILSHDFIDQVEEIRFFKTEKPKFLRELIYFTEVFYMESEKPVGSVETQKQYFLKNLDRIRIYFGRNKFLYNYYRTGQSMLDHMFFLRDAQEIPLLPASSVDLDPTFSTPYSYIISKLQALEQLKEYIQSSIRRLDNPILSAQEPRRKKRWHGTKAELIELGYALHSRGLFGTADVKQVINYLEDCFDIKVGNFYRVFQGQRIRKKSRTSFLDSLKENLIRRMDETDLNPQGI